MYGRLGTIRDGLAPADLKSENVASGESDL